MRSTFGSAAALEAWRPSSGAQSIASGENGRSWDELSGATKRKDRVPAPKAGVFRDWLFEQAATILGA